MAKIKPIISSSEMVKAILNGRKTQTRRVIKPQPDKLHKYFNGFVTDSTDRSLIGCAMFSVFEDGGCNCQFAKPPYRPGDIIWVRETWAQTWTPDSNDIGFVYKADGKPAAFPYWGNVKQCKDEVWIPSIFMPKEAARIFLRVTNVRVERLQDISEEDARAEGFEKICFGLATPGAIQVTSKELFTEHWDALNAKRGYSWHTNPWVWVIEFERIKESEVGELGKTGI